MDGWYESHLPCPETGVRLVWFPREHLKTKNVNVDTGVREFQGFKIESLSDVLGMDLPLDARLCPVCCMHHYIDKTMKIRHQNCQYLVTLN